MSMRATLRELIRREGGPERVSLLSGIPRASLYRMMACRHVAPPPQLALLSGVLGLTKRQLVNTWVASHEEEARLESLREKKA